MRAMQAPIGPNHVIVTLCLLHLPTPLQLPESWLPPLDLPGQPQVSLHRSASQVCRHSAS